LLYSSADGERRIRVHNLAIPLTNVKHLCYEFLDVNATCHYFARVALSRLMTNVNFSVTKGMVEMYLSNLCRSLQKSQSSIKSQLPENI